MADDLGTWVGQRARELRKQQTPAEQQLWQQLRAKRFAGYKFRRQEPIGRYIADFVCFRMKLVIELDGSQHAEQHEHDQNRDAWLEEQGFTVLRFWNHEWASQAEAVMDAIWLALNEKHPLPNPSPIKGEGLILPSPTRVEGSEDRLMPPSPLVGEGLGERGKSSGEEFDA